MKIVALVQSDTWEDLYIDGTLRVEGPALDLVDALRAVTDCQLEVVYTDIDGTNGFPYKLTEVVLD